MPRVQVYLPDDLHEELKRRGLPASQLLQIALRAELERQDALDETDRYLDELVAEIGARRVAVRKRQTRCEHRPLLEDVHRRLVRERDDGTSGR